MLLLGAGASYGSKDSKSRDIFMGEQLSKYLCEEIDVPYQIGALGKVYNVAKDTLGARLIKILEERFKNVTPSLALQRLAEHVWPRIYTLNIDDATDKAFIRKSKQNVNIRTINDSWNELDALFTQVDIIKLNGCITKPSEGFIFSPSEYAAASNNPHEWYRQLGRDFLNYTFIFIGTKLDEPLFYQQIEYYKNVWTGSPGTPGKAYLITPSIDELDRRSLAAANIEHISGTLEDFVKWTDGVINRDRSPLEVALARNPELAISDGGNGFVSDFSRIIKVDINKRPKKDIERGKTREFYLGFKPTWDEVFEGVPALLHFQKKIETSVAGKNSKLYSVVGPAGSGKTTSLMMLAKTLSEQGETVYYLNEPIAYLEKSIKKLEQVNSAPYYFFIDRASSVLDGIILSLGDPEIKKAIFVVSERLNVWRKRSEWALRPHNPSVFNTSEISEKDASAILIKLQEFGPWSKIAKISEPERKKQLIEKSKRQLLIGLLELTVGYGFEQIISDDFNKLATNESKILVILTGLATIHGLTLSRDTCLAALNSLGIRTHIDSLLLDTQGIVHHADSQLRARHPVYIDKLFDGKTPLDLKEQAIRGLLLAMTRNEKPISKNMSRNDVMLFKLTINHNFLGNYFHGDKEKILNIFKDFEKFFELDGLFYLQYGLALRDMNMHDHALRKLQSAVESWTMKQTEHAYAQQLLICALESQRELAYRNLELAKGILLRLDARHIEDDTDYPLVTLAEHHVRIAKKFDTAKAVNEVTNHYLKEISNRQKLGRANIRLEQAKVDLLKIATSNNGNGNHKTPTRRKGPAHQKKDL
ncbi:SIR2 family protein [Oryzomicrobium sp.]|uniref:P-loop NTPase n=1 Tax=Oryzomicrobium sp. TaxID=1911578 RepID=UPI0025FDDF3C|nr:SIR2 family protein [Oryzomicrobium sp.]MCE1243128.1 SIR2 family protein [Oryzomicrobium sp.]